MLRRHLVRCPMPPERATGLIVRTTDWSETSRIATVYTREFGKVRLLAKGGRRLKSSFEVALDLLTVCDMVLLRKSSGGLDLLTEARLAERFPGLRGDLGAFYAACYVAELLADATRENDPHPPLFDAALAALRDFGRAGESVSLRLLAFELGMWGELGFRPVLESCAGCGRELDDRRLSFGPSAGGVLCPGCAPQQRDRRPLSAAAWRLLRGLGGGQRECPAAVRIELRRLLGHYAAHLLGHR